MNPRPKPPAPRVVGGFVYHVWFSAMLGLVLNTADDRIDPASPWRTRMEVRHHPPLFVLEDGTPVFEVWFWYAAGQRWFCMSRGYDLERARAGVVYFDSLEQLRSQLALLRPRKAA